MAPKDAVGFTVRQGQLQLHLFLTALKYRMSELREWIIYSWIALPTVMYGGGLPEGVAELKVYYCEQAIGFSNGVGLDDEGYYDALVRMFETSTEDGNR
jgi:hypothetical protein